MENPVRTLLISSAEPKDGKSTIAANLAYTMAQSGRKVILIDGDLRVPTQHKIFNVDNNVGLSSVLEQKASFAEAVQSTEFLGLQVLSSGPVPKNPSGLLGSSQMKKLIEELSNTFELVIIDSPAMLAVADASVLAPMVDAVAIVVCRTKTNLGAVRALQAQLNKVRSRSIGVIVNRAEDKSSHYYYYNRKEAFLPK
jgi:capsular exopolysaccharide synthesis family protein